MFSKTAKVAAALTIAAVGIVGVAADASALNLNTHAAAFQPYSGTAPNAVEYTFDGVRSAFPGAVTTVIAPVPRSGISNPTQSFFIDGSNNPGWNTSFVLSAYSFNGTPQSSVSFASSAANYDLLQTLPTISSFSYVSLLANIPPAGVSKVRGVTAVQP